MSLEKETPFKQNLNSNNDSFAIEISRKDEIKQLKKKMAMLKAAIIDQRKKKNHLTEELAQVEDKLKKYQTENKKKQEKNEALMTEIKSLKDALIVERNQKQKCLERLQCKLGSQLTKQDGNKTKMDSNRFFGLKALFQK